MSIKLKSYGSDANLLVGSINCVPIYAKTLRSSIKDLVDKSNMLSIIIKERVFSSEVPTDILFGISELPDSDWIVLLGLNNNSELFQRNEVVCVSTSGFTKEEIVRLTCTAELMEKYHPQSWFFLRNDCVSSRAYDVLANISVSFYENYNGGLKPIMWISDDENDPTEANTLSLGSDNVFMSDETISSFISSVKEKYPSVDKEMLSELLVSCTYYNLGTIVLGRVKFCYNRNFMGYNGNVSNHFIAYPLVAKAISILVENGYSNHNMSSDIDFYLLDGVSEFVLNENNIYSEELKERNNEEKEIKYGEVCKGDGVLPMFSGLANLANK